MLFLEVDILGFVSDYLESIGVKSVIRDNLKKNNQEVVVFSSFLLCHWTPQTLSSHSFVRSFIRSFIHSFTVIHLPTHILIAT